MAKAAFWSVPDAERRKLGERTGLDTPVVLAVNVGYWVLGVKNPQCRSKPLSIPPGDYGRKVKTQRN